MRVLLIILSTLFIMSCGSDKNISNEMHGHWIQKDFYNDIKAKKELSKISALKMELIILADDSNLYQIMLGEKSNTREMIPYKKNHVVIRNYFGQNIDADLKLIDNELNLINNTTSEHIVFVKLSEKEYRAEGIEDNQSYVIPYIHNLYISGTYQMDSIQVKFVDQGKVKGLDKIENFSFCYTANCRYNSGNTIFLSNDQYEGNYYEYKITNDSLIIYDIDLYALAKGLPTTSTGVKYAMKKIN